MRIQKLRHSDIHLWVVKLDEAPTGCFEFDRLPEDEKARLKKMPTADGRARFMQARAFLRRVLSSYIGLTPDKIFFRFNRNGKPSLDVEKQDLSFNMSHSHDLVVIAVSKQNLVGVDVEELHEFEDMMEVAIRFFSKKETKLLADAPRRQRARLFFQLWTGKEACVKALGGRISDISLKRTNFQRVGGRLNTSRTKSGLHVRWFSPAPQHVAAVASI